MENTALNQKVVAETDSALLLARKILAEIMLDRRVPVDNKACGDSDCPACSSVHLPRIVAAVRAHRPLTLVLPAYPGKSPNLEKVLGPLPDFAEKLSLQFLGALCRRIQKHYAPGAKIILCSDGRVFSDIVGMKESDVTAYQAEILRMTEDLGLADLSTFNLEDHYGDLDFTQMREELMTTYGSPLEVLMQKVRRGTDIAAGPDEQEATQTYRGITRFLFEDSLHPGQMKSRTALQKEARAKAYEVIRRSNAWSELIAENFPEAVRLSIHPQTCGSKKLGIRLIGNESWMTPWHGVAVETQKGHVLLKRSEAEALNAELVHSPEGRPSHYRLLTEQTFCEKGTLHGL